MSDFAMKYHMKKKMAKGGDLEDYADATSPVAVSGTNAKCAGASCPGCSHCNGGMMAKGGEMMGDDDLVMRIMKKRYAHGGVVEPVADFEPNDFDEMDLEPAEEFSETGANSGDEIGDKAEDEDRKDIVSKIMKSRKKKDHLPRPA